MEIDKLRKEIDIIDEELLPLFLKRMELVTEIAKYKESHGLPIGDHHRDSEILEWAAANSGDLADDSCSFFSALLTLSKARQQVVIEELCEKKIYGLLGETLKHSYSVALHRHFGNENYRLFEVAPAAFGDFLQRGDIGGLNVTIPYKQAALPYCTVLSAEAKAVGCVNTIVAKGEALYGDNTDVQGFRFMQHRAKIGLRGKKVLIFGSGGASLAVQAVVNQENAAEITVISRHGSENYENLDRHRDAEILINATPLGMYPQNGVAPVDLDDFPHCQGVLDLVYNPHRTALLLAAEERGIPCCGGLSMLVAQAKAAEELFFEKKIADKEIMKAMTAVAQTTVNIVFLARAEEDKLGIGRQLAALSGRIVVNIDKEIEKAEKKTVKELHSARGEAAFCCLEREYIQKYGKEGGLVILVGENAINDDANYGTLRQNGRLYQCKHENSPSPTAVGEGRRMIHMIDGIASCDDTDKAALKIWQDFCKNAEK